MGPATRVNAQGLHFVDNTVMSEAWFRPDADLTQYNKLMIVSAGTRFVDAEAASGKQRKRYERFEEIMVEQRCFATGLIRWQAIALAAPTQVDSRRSAVRPPGLTRCSRL
ncbi:MAG: hypothetical protein AAGA23_21260 [Pseudomonadota bacterium]